MNKLHFSFVFSSAKDNIFTMNTIPILLALVIGLTFIDISSQYVAAPTCFGQVCPVSTASCKEDKKSSPDKSRIEIKISCLDQTESSVKEYYFEEPSHLDRYTTYQNTRYESIDEGISHYSDPYKSQTLDLTPYHQQPEYF